MMHNMSKEEYKNSLLKEKDLLLAELKELGAKFDPELNNWEAVPINTETESDENDLGDKFEDYNLQNEKVETLEGRLKDINSALEKIENGNFGKCEICGNQIEEDRLSANPAAKTCKVCMNK